MIGILYLIPICLAAFLAGLMTMVRFYVRTADRLQLCEQYLAAYDTSFCADYWKR